MFHVLSYTNIIPPLLGLSLVHPTIWFCLQLGQGTEEHPILSVLTSKFHPEEPSQQVDQSFTSRRHRGHGSANATRNNTNANDHTTIAKASIASSEYHTMEAFCGGPGYTSTVGCRAATYSTSSGM
jgi:hypothetical protein